MCLEPRIYSFGRLASNREARIETYKITYADGSVSVASRAIARRGLKQAGGLAERSKAQESPREQSRGAD